MYTKNVLAVSGALLSAVAAVPMNKRDLVWVTHTDVVMETVLQTKTVYADGTEATGAPAPYHYGHHNHHPGGHSHAAQPTSEAVAPASSSAPESSAPAPESTYVAPTTSAYVAPTTSTSVYVPPTTSEYVAPTTSAYVAPTTTKAYVAPTTSAAAAPSSSSSSGGSSSGGNPSGQTYSGDITYYTPGLGSCGMTSTDSEPIVAISYKLMGTSANPNANPYCNKKITINYQGKKTSATIVDTCPGCSGEGDLDMSSSLFKEVAPNGDGRVHDVEWWFDESV